jgi:hypothetical protein
LQAEQAVIPGQTGGDGMIDLMHQFEVRAILAEKEREAKATLRVSEAKSGPRGLTAAFGGSLARLGMRAKRERTDLSPSRGLREPSVKES